MLGAFGLASAGLAALAYAATAGYKRELAIASVGGILLSLIWVAVLHDCGRALEPVWFLALGAAEA